jgi:hypothetical protein
VALRWSFPIWTPDVSADATKVKGRLSANEQRQNQKDRDGMETTIKSLSGGSTTARNLRAKTGFGEYRQQRLLDLLTSQGHVTFTDTKMGRKTYREYRLAN